MSLRTNRFNLKHDLAFGYALANRCQKCYREFRSDGLPIAAVRFEDVINDPETAMRRVLLFCGLTNRGVRLAEADCRRALSVDSQRGTPLSSFVIDRHPTLDFEEARAECDELAKLHGFESDDPPGTITESDEVAEEETARCSAIVEQRSRQVTGMTSSFGVAEKPTLRVSRRHEYSTA